MALLSNFSVSRLLHVTLAKPDVASQCPQHESPNEFACDPCDFNAANRAAFTIHRDKKPCRENQARLAEIFSVIQEFGRTHKYEVEASPGIFTDYANNFEGRPKTATEASCKLVQNFARENTNDTWSKLRMFAYGAFQTPPSCQCWMAASLATSMKRNILAFEDILITLIHATVKNQGTKKNTADSTEDRLRRHVEAKIQDGDISGAVRLLSSDEAIATSSLENLETVKQKHRADQDNADYSAPPREYQGSPPLRQKRY